LEGQARPVPERGRGEGPQAGHRRHHGVEAAMIRQGGLRLSVTLLALASRLAAQTCSTTEHAGVTLRVVEDAHDGQHEICPERLVPVDANSDLLIQFVTPPAVESVTASPEWKQLAETLEQMRDLEREVARLNAAPTPSDSAGRRELQRQASASDLRVQS